MEYAEIACKYMKYQKRWVSILLQNDMLQCSQIQAFVKLRIVKVNKI